MKKVVFYTQSLFKGGAERVVTLLAERFALAGFDTTVATIDKGENEYPLTDHVRRVYVGLQPSDQNKGRLTRMYLRRRYLRDFLKQERPDVVISFLKHPILYSLSAVSGLHIPVITAERSNPEVSFASRFDRLCARIYMKRAAGYVFQTKGQHEFFIPYIPQNRDNSIIILNPVTATYINVPPAAVREKSVVHHARLVDFKDQQLMIRAFVRVHEKHPDYCLKIYGNDSHDGTKELLEKTIAETGSAAYCFLLGGDVAFEEVIPKGSVYLFSSYYEGLSNSVLEAMAMGMPIVATDCPCGGNRTLITDGVNGLLVPIREEEPMAEAVCKLIEDRDLAERLGLSARKITERANIDSIFEQWRDYVITIIDTCQTERTH